MTPRSGHLSIAAPHLGGGRGFGLFAACSDGVMDATHVASISRDYLQQGLMGWSSSLQFLLVLVLQRFSLGLV